MQSQNLTPLAMLIVILAMFITLTRGMPVVQSIDASNQAENYLESSNFDEILTDMRIA